MPELPEVETIKLSLKNKLNEVRIVECKAYYNGSIKYPSVEKFIQEVTGSLIKDIERRGKYLKLILNTKKVILIHLRMTGRLLLAEKRDPATKHTHVIFELDNGLQLRFVDIRKFGTLMLIAENELNKIKNYALLGPEPLGEKFTLEGFKSAVKDRKKAIKNLLLEQEVVAGIGNIYADEILHSAGISPFRCSDSLRDDELEKLYFSIKEELQKGIKNKGTSFRDYVNSNGMSGTNQDFLKIYRKEGQACVNCGCDIKRKKIGNRGTHFCVGCQK